MTSDKPTYEKMEAALKRANHRAFVAEQKRFVAEVKVQTFIQILKDLVTDNFEDLNHCEGWE